MSTTSTVLVFVLTPAAIVLVIAALSLAGGSGRRSRRYRPGRPFEFTPVWFLSSPERGFAREQVAVGGGAQPPALTGGEVETGGRLPAGATGGASDRW